MLMDTLVRYYLHQAGHGRVAGKHNGIGPIYAAPPFLQRGYEDGSFLAGLWRMVRPVLWSGAKTMGRESLRAGSDILNSHRQIDGRRKPSVYYLASLQRGG